MATRAVEKRIAGALGELLQIDFRGARYTLDDWGQTDDVADLSPTDLLLLEVEATQKHPNTNVLKLWPYLDSNEQLSIVLIQAFFEGSPGLHSNRGRLADWTAARMEETFGSRFRFAKVVFNENFEPVSDLEPMKAVIESVAGDV